MAHPHDAGRAETADDGRVELTRPLVIVEGRGDDIRAPLAACLASLARAGWTIVPGWVAPLVADRIVCTGEIVTTDDARRALLAAIAGAGLVVAASADPLTIDRLLDDLRRIGPVEHVVGAGTTAGALAPPQCSLPARRGHRSCTVGACRGSRRWRLMERRPPPNRSRS